MGSSQPPAAPSRPTSGTGARFTAVAASAAAHQPQGQHNVLGCVRCGAPTIPQAERRWPLPNAQQAGPQPGPGRRRWLRTPPSAGEAASNPAAKIPFSERMADTAGRGWCRGSGMRLLGRWSAGPAWTASRSGALSRPSDLGFQLTSGFSAG